MRAMWARVAVIFLWVSASWAAVPSQGEQLLKLGFYSGAEDAFRKVETTGATPESTKGLIQALLAQGKWAKAAALLNSENAKNLNSEQIKLYTSLVSFQQGVVLPLGYVKEESLDTTEQQWLRYARGLQAFAQGQYDEAQNFWSGLPQESVSALWAQASLKDSEGEDLQAGKELQKRLKKLRRQDWPVASNVILGMLARGQNLQARNFIDRDIAKLPKAQAGLLRALTFPARTPERTEALMALLPTVDDPALLTIVIGFCANEVAINLSDVEQQLGDKRTQAPIALILAQAWVQKGSLGHAYELLVAAKPESLPAEWQAAYYSTLASLCSSSTPARYREAANALIKWRGLPTTTPEQALAIDQQIADAYFKNADYADAAAAYEKNTALFGVQAVIAWLKADKPEEARRVLQNDFAGRAEALLAYLMDARRRGTNVEDAYKQLEGGKLDIASRWPIEYLRVVVLEEKNPQAALEKILAVNDIPADASYKVHFDLKRYQLLVQLHKTQEANDLLDEIVKNDKVPEEFALIALSRALMDQKPQEAIELLPKVEKLSPSDKVKIMLLVARQLGNAPKELERIEGAIEALPSAERVPNLIILAQRWAEAGDLNRALTIVEALQESAVEGTLRDEIDFLRASLDELAGNPLAEAQWVALSQREAPEIKQRALIRLAAYYASRGKSKEAQTLFYAQLASFVSGRLPENFSSKRDEILKSFAAIATALPAQDADRVNDWIEAQGRPMVPGN